ncbi:MAG TPA: glycosyltransferase family 9 protein [Flavobacterium sp.]|jgi:ADP-heptose:LPS heptosyltransferase
MGDVAMTVPVLRAFSKQYPGVKITMVSRPFFEPFFDGISNLSFFAIDLDVRHKGLSGLFRLFFDLKKLKINAFADLHNVLRSKIVGALLSLSGIPTATVDKARAEKKALTRAKNKIFQPLKPIATRHAEVFGKLGFALDLSQVDFPVPEISDTAVKALAGEKGNLKWIGIAPFAQYASKVYPHDLMKHVVSHLASHQNHRIFLFGSKSEVPALQALAPDLQNVIITGGKLDLRHELQLIGNLDVMLSMDSGNGHIAAMLGVKVVTLWGATHPFAGFAPFNQPADNAITADRSKYPLLPTSVYGNKNTEGYEDAMRTTLPETVIDKILSLL